MIVTDVSVTCAEVIFSAIYITCNKRSLERFISVFACQSMSAERNKLHKKQVYIKRSTK